MPIFNYKAKEMIVKIVFYGPGLCGKTTSLQYLHQQTIPERKGELYFLATEMDQTIYFELLPLHVGEIKNFKLRLQVYTVPGQVKYNNTRKAVLQGVDAIVFVGDSQKTRQEANMISFKNLQYNLKGGYNVHLKDIPLVYQYNKRDMKNLLSVDELNRDLNPWRLPYFETIAINGDGVLDAFEAISSLSIQNLEKRFLQGGKQAGKRKPKSELDLFKREEKNKSTAKRPNNLISYEEPAYQKYGEPSALLDGQTDILGAEGQILPEEGNVPVDTLYSGQISDEPLFPGRQHKELTYSDIVAVTYHDGDIIFDEGESGDEMYFIEEGEVKIIGSYKETRKVVATYSKGDFFGEMALFGGKDRSARAIAIGKTQLLPVKKETLSTQIMNKPELSMAMLEALSGRIRYSTKIISKLAGQNKDLVQQLQKARNVIQQMKEQNKMNR